MIKITRAIPVLDCDNIPGGDFLVEIVDAILSAGYTGVRISLEPALPGISGRMINCIEYNDQTPEGRLLAFLQRWVCDGRSLASFTVTSVMEGLSRAHFDLACDSLSGEERV